MANTIVRGGTIVNERRSFTGDILINNGRIELITEGKYTGNFTGQQINAQGKLVLPGIIDDQVHFRDPGLTYKADIHTESIAAAAGGVTSFMDMPNTVPATTSLEELETKFESAAVKSLINYSFYLGATNDNLKEITRVDPRMVCGVKLFMGSSTGNMLVDNDKSLCGIFAESPVLIATHCESEEIIRANTARYRQMYPVDAPPSVHPLIRSAEACYRSTAHAVELADKYESNLHVLHLSTARELSLFDNKPLRQKKITNELCVHHLWFTDADYKLYGNRIKWNPAIKTEHDRQALRNSLLNGKGDMVATDHAPHTQEEKSRTYWDCPSGGPLVQHSLQVMLELVSQGVIDLETVVAKMCHAPAVRFRISERGYLREGYFADITIVDPSTPYTVSKENILYKCGWSPFEGTTFGSTVHMTIVNGKIVYQDGTADTSIRGQALTFDR